MVSAAADAPRFDCTLHKSEVQLPFGLNTGDWNEDGRTDLIISYASGHIVPFLATNNGWNAQQAIATGRTSRGIAVRDLDGDKHLDLIVANAGSEDVAVLHGDGKGSFKEVRRFSPGISPFHPYLVDLDGSPVPDLVIVNESNWAGTAIRGTVTVIYDFASPQEAKPVNLTAGIYPAAAAFADFDKKPGLDLAVVNWQSATLSLFANQGKRSFAPHRELQYGGLVPYGVYSDDFNGDGNADLAITDVNAGGVWVMHGDGQGDFAAARSFAAGIGARCVVGADVDGDGQQDLVTADTAAGTVSILSGAKDGSFAAPLAIPVGPSPRMVHAEDLDRDGKVDLVATLLGGTEIAILRQTTGKGTPCPKAEPVKR
ncbi:MAG TPA: VCBS repeat-containing protein [Terriglobales bacterium]|nr:VCBS repeat-containing protein [Terriglobales bacterium]